MFNHDINLFPQMWSPDAHSGWYANTFWSKFFDLHNVFWDNGRLWWRFDRGKDRQMKGMRALSRCFYQLQQFSSPWGFYGSGSDIERPCSVYVAFFCVNREANAHFLFVASLRWRRVVFRVHPSEKAVLDIPELFGREVLGAPLYSINSSRKK